MNQEEEIKKLKRENKGLKRGIWIMCGVFVLLCLGRFTFDMVSNRNNIKAHNDKMSIEIKAAECRAKNMCIEEIDGEYECIDCKTLGIE